MRKPLVLLLVGLVIGALLGALTVWQLSSEPELHEFTIGETTFVFRGWTSDEEEELRQLLERAFPILKEIYGGEPVNIRGEEGVEVLFKKETSLAIPLRTDPCGREDYLEGSDLYLIALKSTDHRVAVHEVASVVFGPLQISGGVWGDIYDEGFSEAATTLVRDHLGEEFVEKEGSCVLTSKWDQVLMEEKPQLAAGDTRLVVLEEAREVLWRNLWLDVLGEDPQFFAKVRQRLLEIYQKGTSTFDLERLSIELFSGDWDRIRDSHPVLGEPLTGSQVVIVPSPRGDPPIEQLVAVTFVAGGVEKELSGVDVKVTQWVDGQESSYTAQTNKHGWLTLLTAEELWWFGGCTLRFRVETDFGSDEVTFTPDPDEPCTTRGRFGANGLYHFYKQNH